MKKILSVILAIMMIFGAMSIAVSAAPATTSTVGFGSNIVDVKLDPNKHTIVVLDFGTGKALTGLYVYDVDAPGFIYTDGVTGKYLMLPQSESDMKPGTYINLPPVGAPEGLTCQGWEIRGTGEVVGHGVPWKIPEGKQGQIIELVARYTTAAPEEDTMAMILGILMKVFGTIIGILFLDGSSAAGVELMEKMLGGLLG